MIEGQHQEQQCTAVLPRKKVYKKVAGINTTRDQLTNKLYFNLMDASPSTKELLSIRERSCKKWGTDPIKPKNFSFLNMMIDIHQKNAIRRLGLDIGVNSDPFERQDTVL